MSWWLQGGVVVVVVVVGRRQRVFASTTYLVVLWEVLFLVAFNGCRLFGTDSPWCTASAYWCIFMEEITIKHFLKSLRIVATNLFFLLFARSTRLLLTTQKRTTAAVVVYTLQTQKGGI